MKYVVAYRWDGLGTRLIAIANAMRFADMQNCPWKFIWPFHIRAGSSEYPAELFDPAFLREHCTMPEWLLHHAKVTTVGNAIETVVPSSMMAFDALVVQGAYTMRLDTEANQDVYTVLQSYFAKIRYHPDVLTRVSKYNGLEFDVGLHVRRGDVVDHPEATERTRLIDVEHFFDMVDKLKPRRFYICSDDSDIPAQFRERYGDACVSAEEMPVGRSQNSELAFHLSDILTLAKCRLLISSRSAFSRCAEYISGAPNITFQYLPERGGNVVDGRRTCLNMIRSGYFEAAQLILDDARYFFASDEIRRYISRLINSQKR